MNLSDRIRFMEMMSMFKNMKTPETETSNESSVDEEFEEMMRMYNSAKASLENAKSMQQLAETMVEMIPQEAPERAEMDKDLERLREITKKQTEGFLPIQILVEELIVPMVQNHKSEEGKTHKSLTREQAMDALLNGKTLRHELFSDEEWIKGEGGFVLTEDSYTISLTVFFSTRKSEVWQTGWSIIN